MSKKKSTRRASDINWRETAPIAAGLVALFFLPWGPRGATGLRWSWDVVENHYPEAIPAIGGLAAGVFVLLAARFASARMRDLLWSLFGFVLLGAGISEASTAFAARGLGPALLVAAGLAAVSHELRLAGELPRLRRLLALVAFVLCIVHYLAPMQDGRTTTLRFEVLWRFASGAQAVPQGAVAFEALLLYAPILFVGSGALALFERPASALDKFLAFMFAYGLPGMLLVSAIPIFMYMPPTHATGYLAVASSLIVVSQLFIRGTTRALCRAARGEYAEAEPRPFFARFALCALSGAMITLSFPRYDETHLAWVALVPALFVITGADRPKRAFLWGWFTGIVANLGCFYWVGELLTEFALLPYPVAFLVSLVLAAHNGVVFALWAYVVRRFDARTRFPLALLATLAFVGAEFLWWEIFPWYIGNSQSLFLPALQIADITGVSGISFLVLFTAFTLHALVRAAAKKEPFPKQLAYSALVVLVVCLGYGVVRIEMMATKAAQAPKLKIGVAQANVTIREPDESYTRKIELQERMTRDLATRGADLVVLPESALPFTFPRSATKLPKLAASFGGIPVLFGGSSYGEDDRQYNTAYLLERDGTIAGTYDKNYPLLFGEYLPLMDKPWMQWVRKALPYASFLTPGESVEAFAFRGHKLGIMICYEDILPRFTRRLAGQHPNLLVNLTNDAWFGMSAEAYQHMALSVVRAVENRLYMVRSVRTGVSGFIDATGKIYAKTDLGRPATLLEDVAMLTGTTVYREVGDVFAYLVLAALAFAIGEAIRRARREERA